MLIKEATKKRIAHAANLSLRFYKRDGWTKEELDQCCEKGQFEVSFEGMPSEYYLITPGSRYDELKIRSLISEIIKPFDRDETIEDIIKSRNW